MTDRDRHFYVIAILISLLLAISAGRNIAKESDWTASSESDAYTLTSAHYYVIDRNVDDGMEWGREGDCENAEWLTSGSSSSCDLCVEKKNNYLGRAYNQYFTAGLRFHLEDQAQDNQFEFARLRMISSPAVTYAFDGASLNSKEEMSMRGNSDLGLIRGGSPNVESSVKLIIRGIDEDSASAFGSGNLPCDQSNLTDHASAWETAGWDILDYPVFVYSPDISEIINEILSRPGWGSGGEGKTVALMIEDNGSSPSEINCVAFRDYAGKAKIKPPVYLELYESVINTFIGGPVLSKPTGTTVSISLAPIMRSDFYIAFGPAGGSLTNYIGNTQTADPQEPDPVTGFGGDVWNSIELKITGLTPGTCYEYELKARKSGSTVWRTGPKHTFMTQRSPGEPFTFAFMTDSHVGMRRDVEVRDAESQYHNNQYEDWEVGFRTIDNAKEANPDFFIVGGDDACTNTAYTGWSSYDAHLRYALVRHLYGDLANSASLFLVLGNHDGEMSYISPLIRAHAYQARKKFIFNPDAETYPFGGGPQENYFAWTWGDALFICLDIFYNTGSEGPVSIEPYGSVWTLGEPQKTWLEDTLISSNAKWKFVFAHHILASWERDGYGRGGAKYAHDWEQGEIHQWMLDHGAQIFFYGHDHVFADGQAGDANESGLNRKGIHYACGSSCFGAGVPVWARDPSQPSGRLAEHDDRYTQFLKAYPYGFFVDTGFVKVRIGPQSVRIDFVRTSLDDAENGEVIYRYYLGDGKAGLD